MKQLRFSTKLYYFDSKKKLQNKVETFIYKLLSFRQNETFIHIFTSDNTACLMWFELPYWDSTSQTGYWNRRIHRIQFLSAADKR